MAGLKTSRRDFLSTVAAAAPTLLSFRWTALDTLGPHGPGLDCAILDLQSHCALRESLHGYQAAFAHEQSYFSDAIPDFRFRCGMIIVPGLGRIEPTLAQALSQLLKTGTHLLLESGAGFLSTAEFAEHQKMLDRYFDITVEPPIDLWSRNSNDEVFFSHGNGRNAKRQLSGHQSIPYVNYAWPRKTKVRDFSRVTPVSAKTGDIIGSVGAVPVALKRRMGKGILIFLGSPLGPALRAGDPEAHAWLRLVTRSDWNGRRFYEPING
jgi:hypothetical protein